MVALFRAATQGRPYENRFILGAHRNKVQRVLKRDGNNASIISPIAFCGQSDYGVGGHHPNEVFQGRDGGSSRDTMDIVSPEKYLEEIFHTQIPITREMGIRVAAYNGVSLVLRAPLAPNVNDKGTAFGGSLYAVLVLAGWGLLHLKLKEEGIPGDVMIHECGVTYSLPVTDGWEARCSLPDDDGYARFVANLRAGGRGKIRLEVSIPRGDRIAVSFSGSYAAVIRTASESVPSPPRTSPAG